MIQNEVTPKLDILNEEMKLFEMYSKQLKDLEL